MSLNDDYATLKTTGIIEITDIEIAEKFLKDLENPELIYIEDKDIDENSRIGLELLKKSFHELTK